MKRLTNKVIIEQKINQTSYLSIPQKYVIQKNIKEGQILYASYQKGYLSYGFEKIGSVFPVKVAQTGYDYLRVSIPKRLDFEHEKGTRYDVYVSEEGLLMYGKI